MHKNKHSESYRKRRKLLKRKANIAVEKIILEEVEEEIVDEADEYEIYKMSDSEQDSVNFVLVPDENESDDDADYEKDDNEDENESNVHKPRYIIQRLDNVKDAVRVAKLNQSPTKKESRISKPKNNKTHLTKSEVELAVQNLIFSDSNIQVQSTCEIHSTEPTEIDVINP